MACVVQGWSQVRDTTEQPLESVGRGRYRPKVMSAEERRRFAVHAASREFDGIDLSFSGPMIRPRPGQLHGASSLSVTNGTKLCTCSDQSRRATCMQRYTMGYRPIWNRLASHSRRCPGPGNANATTCRPSSISAEPNAARQKNSSWMLSGSRNVSIAFWV